MVFGEARDLHAARRRIEEILGAIGFGRVIGPLGEALRGGKALRQSRLMENFYSALLPKGALVFDVGANVGTMTGIFASLGARVVAVEPNADCARHIELSMGKHDVEVLPIGISDHNGLAALQVSDRKDKMSTFSENWRRAVTADNPSYDKIWSREVTVATATLDSLIERYGLPFYIKIDVEGHEEQALRGLSHRPALLSFEFNKVFLEPALRALDLGIFAGASFNYTLVDPVRFELQTWVDKAELQSKLRALGEKTGLGDIFARWT